VNHGGHRVHGERSEKSLRKTETSLDAPCLPALCSRLDSYTAFYSCLCPPPCSQCSLWFETFLPAVVPVIYPWSIPFLGMIWLARGEIAAIFAALFFFGIPRLDFLVTGTHTAGRLTQPPVTTHHVPRTRVSLVPLYFLPCFGFALSNCSFTLNFTILLIRV
jgi:hypothetical protein